MGSKRPKNKVSGVSGARRAARIYSVYSLSLAAKFDMTTMSREEVLRVKLQILEREHRDLDDAIAALDASGRADQLAVRRLKKRKLQLRDAIQTIHDELTPDIIA